MPTYDPDIPERFRGDQSVFIAELDGSPMILPTDIDAIGQSDNGPVNLKDLPRIAVINGISKVAIDRLAEIVGNWHSATGVPIMPITRSAVLKALVSETN